MMRCAEYLSGFVLVSKPGL